jgi:hypothetical protein
MKPEARREHRWLQRLVGEWRYEMEAVGPDGAPMRERGRASGRALGELWVQVDFQSEQGAEPMQSVLTLGFDAQKGRVVGMFVASVMETMWIYEGAIDEASDTVALHAEGPDFSKPGTTARYVDRIRFEGDDRWIMTSAGIGPDGSEQRFMTATYSRS